MFIISSTKHNNQILQKGATFCCRYRDTLLKSVICMIVKISVTSTNIYK